eukprot:MONOS_14609.1-p1 / transcript=MONOS_14609.1 / gene=MONOS_14609 / organism=Monocercomonoides_exilis_PA203 / gene_product=unspecified product / transcript_product=unspecified product / location=Mono_scaffold01034:18289-19423(+) / protein_length=235 / sequence_SO=supercontig / SO=protein_coding / is_pseudo=false
MQQQGWRPGCRGTCGSGSRRYRRRAQITASVDVVKARKVVYPFSKDKRGTAVRAGVDKVCEQNKCILSILIIIIIAVAVLLFRGGQTYDPKYTVTDAHVGTPNIAKTSRPETSLVQPVTDIIYDTKDTLTKQRTRTSFLGTREQRPELWRNDHEDNTYNPSYKRVDRAVRGVPALGKQEGRERDIHGVKMMDKFYEVKGKEKNQVSTSFCSVSNPRASGVGDMAREMDFLIHQTE